MEIRTPAKASGIDAAIALASEFIAAAQLAATEQTRLKIVVEELARNIVMHGRTAEDSSMSFALDQTGDGVRISVRDHGIAFDPRTDLGPIDRDQMSEDGVEGGIGWPLILQWCRIETVKRVDDENHLVLLLNT